MRIQAQMFRCKGGTAGTARSSSGQARAGLEAREARLAQVRQALAGCR